MRRKVRVVFASVSCVAVAALAAVATVVSLGTLAACGGSSRDGFDSSDAGGASSSGGSSGGLGGGDAASGSDAGAGVTLLYAHTDTTLFQLDPAHLDQPPQTVGDFDCVGTGQAAKTMTDLAVARDGKLYGVSEGAAFPLTIQGSTVHCDATWSLPQTKFYGLTVAPVNTVEADEVLIAADGNGGLWRIDATSGTPTQVGTLGTDPKTNQPWALSGDIVFMANNGSPIGFATVRTCPKGNCTTTDTLIEVDVKAIKPGTQSVLKSVRGAVTKGAWCTNASSPSSFGSMFGIVAYEDKVYGFSRSGDVVEIHSVDGSGCLVQSIPADKFSGAGITTSAPVIAPPVN
jgi:hypothetical protein